jgi:hypothetical protein
MVLVSLFYREQSSLLTKQMKNEMKEKMNAKVFLVSFIATVSILFLVATASAFTGELEWTPTQVMLALLLEKK